MTLLNQMETETLEEISEKNGISASDIENLLEIEKEYELSSRKSWRIERIKEYINNKI